MYMILCTNMDVSVVLSRGTSRKDFPRRDTLHESGYPRHSPIPGLSKWCRSPRGQLGYDTSNNSCSAKKSILPDNVMKDVVLFPHARDMIG